MYMYSEKEHMHGMEEISSTAFQLKRWNAGMGVTDSLHCYSCFGSFSIHSVHQNDVSSYYIYEHVFILLGNMQKESCHTKEEIWLYRTLQMR